MKRYENTDVDTELTEWSEEVWMLKRDHPVCAWCHEPIIGTEFYGIDRETVCRDCVEACRQTLPVGR